MIDTGFTEAFLKYYYPELLHIAVNLINIEKEKHSSCIFCNLNRTHVMNPITNGTGNRFCICSWCSSAVMPAFVKKFCLHAKNMILTVQPEHSMILSIQKQEYVSIEEAELDQENQFLKVIRSQEAGLHILKAQAGISKTNLYLKHIRMRSV